MENSARTSRNGRLREQASSRDLMIAGLTEGWVRTWDTSGWVAFACTSVFSTDLLSEPTNQC